MKRHIYGLYSRTFLSRAAWSLIGRCLRILAYHGVCEDEHAHHPWIPPYFVTRKAFEQQLQYLSRHACLLRLSEAVRLLNAGKLPQNATCLTFDDGYANNLRHAVPLLEKYSAPATIFIVTGHASSGELLPFDRARLVQLHRTGIADDSPFYEMTLDDLERQFAAPWNELKNAVPQQVFDELRPMTVEELRTLPGDLIEIGAHSRTHCVLPKESPERRRQEIIGSLQEIIEWTSNPRPMFSYPTGAFEQSDRELVAQYAPAAVTTATGLNRVGSDSYTLKRYPVSLNHDLHSFIAEVTGFRTLLLKYSLRA